MHRGSALLPARGRGCCLARQEPGPPPGTLRSRQPCSRQGPGLLTVNQNRTRLPELIEPKAGETLVVVAAPVDVRQGDHAAGIDEPAGVWIRGARRPPVSDRDLQRWRVASTPAPSRGRAASVAAPARGRAASVAAPARGRAASVACLSNGWRQGQPRQDAHGLWAVQWDCDRFPCGNGGGGGAHLFSRPVALRSDPLKRSKLDVQIEVGMMFTQVQPDTRAT